MTTPTTALDERFSAPDTAATSWDDARRVLVDAQLSWITTVRADGRPHATPLVAVWLDGALHFSTGAGEQKGVNLAANPHVVLTTGQNRWDAGLEVVVEGRAVPVTDDVSLARLAEAWTTKWDGSWRFEVRDGGLSAAGQRRAVARVPGRARQGAGLRPGHLHADPAPVLTGADRRGSGVRPGAPARQRI